MAVVPAKDCLPGLRLDGVVLFWMRTNTTMGGTCAYLVYLPVYLDSLNNSRPMSGICRLGHSYNYGMVSATWMYTV